MHKEADIQAVHNLIAVLADPVKAKAHLDEIKQHSAKAEEARVDRVQAGKAYAAARDESEKNTAEFAKQSAALDARKKELDGKESYLSERMAAFGPREAALVEREKRLSSAEGTIQQRDQESQRRAEKVVADEKAFALKAQRLQEAVSA